MRNSYNVYCDESCHLENDESNAMALGAIWCEVERAHDLADQVKKIKREYFGNPRIEIKWNSVSPSGLEFFHHIIDYFFSCKWLRYRGLLVPDKKSLDHHRYRQDHDTWYYKMYYQLLKEIICQDAEFRIFLDIKDTRGAKKIAHLHDVLCCSIHDFEHASVPTIQLVRSYEVALLQLADLITGCITYSARELCSSEAKMELVEHVRRKAGIDLKHSTRRDSEKFNLFVWRPNFKR